VGFAGAANASATIDLIWAGSGTPTTSAVSTPIVLNVVVTAGPNGVTWAGVSVDYSAALSTLSVLGYASTPSDGLPNTALIVTDSGTQIIGLNIFCGINFCSSLWPGESLQVGTVQFHNSGVVGTFTVSPVFVSEQVDAILNFSGIIVSDTTTLNPAFVSNVSEPDFDGDGVADNLDNCSEAANPAQDDTDLDDCGNLCDADYTQDGKIGTEDFGAFLGAFGTNDQEFQHTPPIDSTTLVGTGDFGFYMRHFGKVPGPSGTTAGTRACP
jgi:hypothetical protein